MVATKIAFFMEGEDEGLARVFTLDKAALDIRLSDLKACYNGPEGLFLVKTPDQYNFHWSLITDEETEVPTWHHDLILAKVKSINRGGTWVSYYIEGTYDARPCVTCIDDKPPTQVTLRDIKRTYGGLPGAFFFKEEDPSTGSHSWTLVNDDSEIVPSIGGWVLGKIRLHAPSDVKYCVIAVHVEGLPHPYTNRIPKPAADVTMADVRVSFQHLVPPGDFSVRSPGGQFVPTPADEVVLPNEKGLIQLRLKPQNAPVFSAPKQPHVSVPEQPHGFELPPFSVVQQQQQQQGLHAQAQSQHQQHSQAQPQHSVLQPQHALQHPQSPLHQLQPPHHPMHAQYAHSQSHHQISFQAAEDYISSLNALQHHPHQQSQQPQQQQQPSHSQQQQPSHSQHQQSQQHSPQPAQQQPPQMPQQVLSQAQHPQSQAQVQSHSQSQPLSHSQQSPPHHVQQPHILPQPQQQQHHIQQHILPQPQHAQQPHILPQPLHPQQQHAQPHMQSQQPQPHAQQAHILPQLHQIAQSKAWPSPPR